MGQIEINNFLKKEKNVFFTSKQIKKFTKVSSVDKSLRQMRYYKTIDYKGNNARYYYKYKTTKK